MRAAPLPQPAFNPKRPRYFQELVTIGTTAQPLYVNLPGARLVRGLVISVYNIGTAGMVSLGTKDNQLTRLYHTGDDKTYGAYGAVFDAAEIFAKADVGTTTVLLVEGYEV
jgi:hypothetical protein